MKNITNEAKKLLEAIPKERPVGNLTLMRQLGLEAEEYFRIRDELLGDDPLIETGRGKGGSVSRLSSGGETVPEILFNETRLYPNFEKNLHEWAHGVGYNRFIVEKTAYGGASADGKWSRPDFTLVAIQQYPYVFGKYLDLITFEVKKMDGWNVDSAYEALSHSSSSTESYLAIEGTRAELDKKWHSALQRLEEACTRHGIGLIYFSDNVGDPLEPFLDATRRVPDPYEMNDFLERNIRTPEKKNQIREWVR